MLIDDALARELGLLLGLELQAHELDVARESCFRFHDLSHLRQLSELIDPVLGLDVSEDVDRL